MAIFLPIKLEHLAAYFFRKIDYNLSQSPKGAKKHKEVSCLVFLGRLATPAALIKRDLSNLSGGLSRVLFKPL